MRSPAGLRVLPEGVAIAAAGGDGAPPLRGVLDLPIVSAVGPRVAISGNGAPPSSASCVARSRPTSRCSTIRSSPLSTQPAGSARGAAQNPSCGRATRLPGGL